MKKKPAYYNEIDPFAAKWLRNLIKAGHIAAGDVDERSIEDVLPSDLKPYAQCHFFAGIGVWSHALRKARWSDDREVWTGSCPCQPFSAAGKGAGFTDERHLWPSWHHLIEQCKPTKVFGEQVASKDGLNWLDLVHADMEASGYAFGAVDLCAAGVGAPHIRQRLWFVADSDNAGLERRWKSECQSGFKRLAGQGSVVGRMADTQQHDCGCEAETPNHRQQETDRPANWSCGCGGASCGRPGPTNGHWRDADWLLCRDGRWRSVEPGTFPLAYGASSRVGRLRAYGNAINAEVACNFIEASIEAGNVGL